MLHRERKEALDPNTTPQRLLEIVKLFPQEVEHNPVLPLIALEDPVLYRKIWGLSQLIPAKEFAQEHADWYELGKGAPWRKVETARRPLPTPNCFLVNLANVLRIKPSRWESAPNLHLALLPDSNVIQVWASTDFRLVGQEHVFEGYPVGELRNGRVHLWRSSKRESVGKKKATRAKQISCVGAKKISAWEQRRLDWIQARKEILRDPNTSVDDLTATLESGAREDSELEGRLSALLENPALQLFLLEDPSSESPLLSAIWHARANIIETKARRPIQTASQEKLARWGMAVAPSLLTVWEENHPTDLRPRRGIEMALRATSQGIINRTALSAAIDLIEMPYGETQSNQLKSSPAAIVSLDAMFHALNIAYTKEKVTAIESAEHLLRQSCQVLPGKRFKGWEYWKARAETAEGALALLEGKASIGALKRKSAFVEGTPALRNPDTSPEELVFWLKPMEIDGLQERLEALESNPALDLLLLSYTPGGDEFNSLPTSIWKARYTLLDASLYGAIQIVGAPLLIKILSSMCKRVLSICDRSHPKEPLLAKAIKVANGPATRLADYNVVAGELENFLQKLRYAGAPRSYIEAVLAIYLGTVAMMDMRKNVDLFWCHEDIRKSIGHYTRTRAFESDSNPISWQHWKARCEAGYALLDQITGNTPVGRRSPKKRLNARRS